MTVISESADPSSTIKHHDPKLPDRKMVVAVDPEKLVNLLRSVVDEAIQKIESRAVLSLNPSGQPNWGSPPSKTGLDLATSEKLKAADLRIAFLIGKLPESAGLLLDTMALAKLLAVSRASVFRLQAEGALPKPIKLGRMTKWRAAEIVAWIEADCPNGEIWDAMRQGGSRRGKR